MEESFEAEKRNLATNGSPELISKPWVKEARLGPYRLIVQYHRFGEDPAANEPVATMLSRTQLCATFVCAHCHRVDMLSGARKKRLQRVVAESERGASKGILCKETLMFSWVDPYVFFSTAF